MTKKGMTKKRVVGATALVLIAAAIGTVPAVAGQGPDGDEKVGSAVSWASTDGAAYISDYSEKPKSKKWRRDHRNSTGNFPGRWQTEVVEQEIEREKARPSIPPVVGTEAGTHTETATETRTETVTEAATQTATQTETQTQTETYTPTVSATSGSASASATGTASVTAEPTQSTGTPGTGESTLPPATGGGAGISGVCNGIQPTAGASASSSASSSAGESAGESASASATASASESAPAPTGATPTAAPTSSATAGESTESAETSLVAAPLGSEAQPSAPGVEVANTAAPDDVMTPCSTTNRSGLPWGGSGLYMPGSSAANAEAFGAWRGAPVDVVVDWTARQSWEDLINPTWIFDSWRGTPYMKAIGVAPVPEADDSATMAGCAAGQYNDKWTQFGQNFKNNGLGDAIIRLGWEFNGNWYKWSAQNPQEYVGCWRQIVTTVRAVAPDMKFDWTVNRGVSAGLADATQAYPGDEYVDIVGIDSYDSWPAGNTEEGWQTHYNGDFGLKFWADFAAEHGKKLAVPEWGLYPGTAHAGQNGGDNSFYINKMVEFFKSLGPNLAYEAYFNEDASYYAGAIFEPNQNPIGSEAYKALYAAAPTGEQADIEVSEGSGDSAEGESSETQAPESGDIPTDAARSSVTTQPSWSEGTESGTASSDSATQPPATE
nr:glycosyl hydrolase [Kineosporia rhizophila]